MTDSRETKAYEVAVGTQGLQAGDVIALYGLCGWGDADDYNPENVQAALLNSTCVIYAIDRSGTVVGLTRAFGDGIIHTALAEILVHPQWRRKGVGKAMLSKLCELHGDTAIFLETYKGQEDFFRSCGFVVKDQMVVMSRRAQNT